MEATVQAQTSICNIQLNRCINVIPIPVLFAHHHDHGQARLPGRNRWLSLFSPLALFKILLLVVQFLYSVLG